MCGLIDTRDGKKHASAIPRRNLKPSRLFGGERARERASANKLEVEQNDKRSFDVCF